MFTVNIGNLLPGERAVARFRHARLHHWQGDSLRPRRRVDSPGRRGLDRGWAGPGLSDRCGLPDVHMDRAYLQGLDRRLPGGWLERCGFYHEDCFRMESRLSWGFYQGWIQRSRDVSIGQDTAC